MYEYVLIKHPARPGYIMEHRLIYEQHHNCCLLWWVHIHHKNGIKTDNRIENLEPMNNSQHLKRHHGDIDTSSGLCFVCGGLPFTNSYDRPQWHIWHGHAICGKCDYRFKYWDKKNLNQ